MTPEDPPQLSPWLQDAWLAAQKDAGVVGVRLYPYRSAVLAGLPTAVHCAPGYLGDDQIPLTKAQLDDSDANLWNHRIYLHVEASDPARAAKLRHELEHVRQWEQHGKPIFDLY